MNKPLISIIVPIYNAEDYLERCLDSIVSQVYTNFECLLIDDGSTDGSYKILEEYAAKDSRFKVFHKENGGLCSARNLGLKNATGEWITHCDSDDYTYPSWLSNFNVENNSDYDLICQGFKSNKKLGAHTTDTTVHGVEIEGTPLFVLEALFENFILGYSWCKIFKREIIIKNNLTYDENIKYCEDEVFLMNYARFCSRFKSVKDIGYFYFVPNWKSKYQPSTTVEKYRYDKMYKSVRVLDENRDSSMYKCYLLEKLEWTERLFMENKTARLGCMKEIRQLVLNNFSLIPITLPIRIIIYLDFTLYFSVLLFNIKNRIKHILQINEE